jgi:two-component system, NtrC family, response regulator AtoC
MKRKVKILVVDDELVIRDSFYEWLTELGYDVLPAENGNKALQIIKENKPEIAFIDLVIPGMDGIEILKRAGEISGDICCVIMTAYGGVSTAITSIKEGAFDYIEKPFCPGKVELLIEKIIEHQNIKKENRLLHNKLDERCSFENIIYKSAKMQRVIELIKAVAKSNATVLITGESGTGKELVARAIHNYSYRCNKPFVAISCAALPENILESELFGHEKGSFTGAHIQRKGKFEFADNGTLFMDEIGEMSPNIQVHLLRVLEEREFMRLGGNELVKVDVRLISATNKDMKQEVKQGKFREDLYYRLNVVNIELPPLRDRKEDIPLLAEYFLRKFALENRKDIGQFNFDAMDILLKYDWPGNVRELENAIERAVILSNNGSIDKTDLLLEETEVLRDRKSLDSITEIEKKHIINVLDECGGNYSKTAHILGISRMTLYNKIKAYSIEVHKIKK